MYNPISFTFRHDPDFLEGVELEHKDDGSKDLDEDWLYEQVQPYWQKFSDRAYKIVYVDLSRESWKEIGIKERLWGQMQLIDDVIVCYGSWHEDAEYQQSKRFGEPTKHLAELTIGLLHEIYHGGYRRFEMEDLTHAYMYGYESLEDDDSQERYTEQADAVAPARQIFDDGRPINLLVIRQEELTDTFKNEVRDIEKVINYHYDQINAKQEHLSPLEEHSWGGNIPDSIVIHTLLGSISGSQSWLENKPLSYHYLISENGELIEQIPPNRCAWHAGVTKYASPKAENHYGSTNPNTRSIGIAFERNGERSLTKEQAERCASLIRTLRDMYDCEKLFSHHDITSYKPTEVNAYKRQVEKLLSGEEPEYKTDTMTRGEMSTVLAKMKDRLLSLLTRL